MYLDNHHGDGRLALWCKGSPGAQEELVRSDPDTFFVPPYVGKAGWVGIELDKGLDWGVIAGLVRDGYLEIAPRRLREKLD
jgi:predicted DNA-binding protein (MmcQ/YjbR family)